MLHTAAGKVEIVLWHVGCRSCGRNFAPLLLMLGLSGKRRTERLAVDLAELGTQMSFARAARIDDQLAGTGASAGQAHNALADVAAVLAPEASSVRRTVRRTWCCSTAPGCAPGSGRTAGAPIWRSG